MNRQNMRPARKSVGLASIPASTDSWQVPGICLGLAALVFVVFGQTVGFQFVNYDDTLYVYQNPMVSGGLTWKGLAWALGYGEIGHWHPLTWIAHMANCQLYGFWAGGHHLGNVVLHAAAVVLLFLTLREMTGCLWPSAFVAAIFAIHPLRAESVAWIAELKDVLSGVFFMLTLLAYARYVRAPSRWKYIAALVVYALGLLSKNTLVTVPFVFLLLDWWPLDRMKPGALPALLKEKVPFFLLSTLSCVATVLAPEKIDAPFRLPFLDRVGTAIVSYGVYLRQMTWPSRLFVPYIDPPGVPVGWQIGLSLAVLAAISALVWNYRAERPYLLAGWLWYLGMLFPMIGIVQISYYSHADRYTYLPGIGVLLAVTWLVRTRLSSGTTASKHWAWPRPRSRWPWQWLPGPRPVIGMTAKHCGTTPWNANRAITLPTATSAITFLTRAILMRQWAISKPRCKSNHRTMKRLTTWAIVLCKKAMRPKLSRFTRPPFV